jgi:hypothetical protein
MLPKSTIFPRKSTIFPRNAMTQGRPGYIGPRDAVADHIRCGPHRQLGEEVEAPLPLAAQLQGTHGGVETDDLKRFRWMISSFKYSDILKNIII